LVAVSLTLSGMIALVNAQDEHEHTEPTDEEFRQLIHDVRGATVQYYSFFKHEKGAIA
jgi:hypothetical protein